MASSSAFVHWPDAPLTNSLVRKALEQLNLIYVDAPTSKGPLLQWSTYDSMDHERVLLEPKRVLSSSYTFRKALIRKHFLSRVTYAYVTKHPDSVLKTAVPETYELEISFADELDELWMDDLYELGDKLDAGETWWILKPGMADRGMGIRIFNSKEQLQEIFQSFESDDEDDDEDDDGDDDAETSKTAVVTSQLRHFVVQEYLPSPLLFDPHEIALDGTHKEAPLDGHKFHLRVYCVASGALKVYVYTRILALFAPVPYAKPEATEGEEVGLGPHLTNTSLQTELGEEHVRLFNELVGRKVLSCDDKIFTEEDLNGIIDQVSDVLGETFKAAVNSPVHFQPVPNAFELYGIDFLVSDIDSSDTSSRFQVKLLEINSEPAIELTGPRLTWILEDLFKNIAVTCVEPFFNPDSKTTEAWAVGETRSHLKKCLDVETRSWD